MLCFLRGGQPGSLCSKRVPLPAEHVSVPRAHAGAFPRALGLRHGLDQNRRCQDWGTDGHYELVFGPRNQHEEQQWSYLRRLGLAGYDGWLAAVGSSWEMRVLLSAIWIRENI